MNDQPVSAIEVRGLVKSWGPVQALTGIDFEVVRGEIFGFLGPNGAGKTTTISILTGLARADRGEFRVAGIDCSRTPKAAQHLMGVVSDESNLYPDLDGRDNLLFCGALYGMRRPMRERRADELLDIFGLTSAAKRKFSGYSKGMKRKLTIAAALMHSPPLLFLDEPTTGIDVASARDIRGLLAGLRDSGTTIFLTTHYIEEAERLCDRIAFIVAGRIVRVDSVKKLMRDAQGFHTLRFSVTTRASDLAGILSTRFTTLSCIAETDTEIRIESAVPPGIGPLIRAIEEAGVEVYEARRIQPSLEEVFVRITGVESTQMKREKERARIPGDGS